MECSSRAPVLKLNRKKKKWSIRRSELSSWFLKFSRVSDDRIVAGCLFHDADLATSNARSPKLVFKHGTWRLPCAAERSWERAVSWAFDWHIAYWNMLWTALMSSRQSLYLVAEHWNNLRCGNALSHKLEVASGVSLRPISLDNGREWRVAALTE